MLAIIKDWHQTLTWNSAMGGRRPRLGCSIVTIRQLPAIH
jgi:hypothetical protein